MTRPDPNLSFFFYPPLLWRCLLSHFVLLIEHLAQATQFDSRRTKHGRIQQNNNCDAARSDKIIQVSLNKNTYLHMCPQQTVLDVDTTTKCTHFTLLSHTSGQIQFLFCYLKYMKYYIIHVFQTNTIHFFSDENVLQKKTPAFFTFLSCISVSNCFLITLYISFKPSLSNQEKKRVSGKTCKQMAILTKEV